MQTENTPPFIIWSILCDRMETTTYMDWAVVHRTQALTWSAHETAWDVPVLWEGERSKLTERVGQTEHGQRQGEHIDKDCQQKASDARRKYGNEDRIVRVRKKIR